MKTAVAKGSVEIEGKKMTLEQMQRLWMQERFARGFENYLKSGEAPTEATRSIFRRFKRWLNEIYRAFSQIGGAPSKEVKAVMDRMIASEDEIDIAMRKKGVDDFPQVVGWTIWREARRTYTAVWWNALRLMRKKRCSK